MTLDGAAAGAGRQHAPTPWRIVLPFALCNFLFVSANWMGFVYLPIYLGDALGFSSGRVGFLIGAYIVTTLLLILPLGYLSDRVSPKRIVQVGAALYIVYGIALASARTFWLVCAAQIAGGAGEAIIVIVLPALLFKDLGAVARGRNVSLLIAGGTFGFSAGPLLAGVLLNVAGLTYRELFIVVSGVSAVLLLMSVLLKNAPPLRIHLADYLGDIRRREVLLVVLAIAGIGIHFGQERKSYSLFLETVRGLPASLGISSVFVVMGLWMGGLMLAIGRLFDRHAHVVVLVGVGLALSGGMHIVTPHVGTFGGVVAVRMFHTIGDVIVVFCFNVLVASIFPQARMGGNTGFSYMFRAVGGVIGAGLAGVFDRLVPSFKLSFAFAGGMMIVVGVVLVLNWRTLRRVSHGIRAEAGH